MSNETLTISIDKDLKFEVKMIALQQNRTVTDIVNELLQDFVNENK